MTKQTFYSALFLVITVVFAIVYSHVMPPRDKTPVLVEPTPYHFIVPQM
jgi:hypothetical protein